ncbi:Methylamine utilization protein MauE [Candidatus Electrothrix marina]|uniref:Methylamine utilization protein MauE n=1 Tax=Candidatus Electrothrix marina TaxID=1859130 RepID=A0A444J202_9BACT|nr:Methylamine utilization protein MauE [Candidatus Electrothrix marina]
MKLSTFIDPLPPYGGILRCGYHTVRLLISGLFLYAGGGKLFALPSFALTISDYGLVPEGLVLPTAFLLVTAELIAAFALLLDLRGGLTGITLLLILFIAVLLYGIQLGLAVDCGCFGSGDQQHASAQGLHQAVYRDLMMLAGCIFLYWYRWYHSTSAMSLRNLKTFPFLNRYLPKQREKMNPSRKGEHNV